MSIFSNINDSKKLNDEFLDEYYSLKWDWIKGERIKWKVILKKDVSIDNLPHLDEKVYYYPQWVFETLLTSALSDVRYNASKFSGKKVFKINLSKLDLANMKVRFNKIIEKCERFDYKGDTFFAMHYLDTNIDGVRNEILTMMYNYISKETFNARYFKNADKTNNELRIHAQYSTEDKFAGSPKYDTTLFNSWNDTSSETI